MRQAFYNLGLAAWLVVDVWRSVQAGWAVKGTDGAVLWLVAAVLAVNAGFVLRRGAPVVWERQPGRLAGVAAAAFFPLVWCWAPVPLVAWGASTLSLELAAAALLGWAVWSLGTNFSVLPERRVVVVGGAYGWIRHPVYAAWLLLDLGYALALSDPAWLVVWWVEAGLLWKRMGWEEEVLAGDSEYVEYRRRVRWRVAPGLA